MKMTTVLIIAGSYRPEGMIDQALTAAAAAVRRAGARVEVVQLRDYPIAFCQNCRECTQQPGEAPGDCVQDDRMRELIAMIEAADAYILASPTNFYSVTALFKRFMERLVVYAYWPWGLPAPVARRHGVSKKALLIASSAAPALLGRLFYATMKQLRLTARTIGARPVGEIFVGQAADSPRATLGARQSSRLERLARRLVQ